MSTVLIPLIALGLMLLFAGLTALVVVPFARRGQERKNRRMQEDAQRRAREDGWG